VEGVENSAEDEIGVRGSVEKTEEVGESMLVSMFVSMSVSM